MLIDGRNFPENHLVEVDVCVIGAGPAGWAIASEFMAGHQTICLVESGGTEVEPVNDVLSSFRRADCDGAYPDPRFTHSRAVGGSSHLWSIEAGANPLVRYTMLDPIDFERRPWVSPASWPFGHESLLPWYDRAHRFSDAGTMDYRPRSWITPDRQPLAFEGERVQSKMFSFANREVFQRQMREKLAGSQRVDLLMWSNVVELEPVEAASHIRLVHVACLNGRRYCIRARQVILATGALDAPRLLLASSRITRQGLGNDSGHVGRYLMDHQLIDVGTLVPNERRFFSRAGFYDQRLMGANRVVANLQLSAAVQSEHQLLNSFFGLCARTRLPLSRIVQRPFGRASTLFSPGVDAFKAWRLPDNGSIRRPGIGAITAMLTHADDLVRANLWRFPRLRPEYNIDHGAWFDDPARDTRFAGFDLYQMCEQAPDADNRITLGLERDAVGMPVGRVRFRWNASDRSSVARSQELLRDELAKAGIGRLRIDRRGTEPILRQMSAHHPAGTTRMADSPRLGVVDGRCRVHGVDNLFIASSSVFPVSGAANPTLTIIALAMRVADDVKTALRGQEVATVRSFIPPANDTATTLNRSEPHA